MTFSDEEIENLIKAGYITKVEKTEDGTTIYLDRSRALIWILSMKSFILSSKEFKNWGINHICNKGHKMFTLLVRDGMFLNNSVKEYSDMYVKYLSLTELYNFDNPLQFGDFYVYMMPVPDDYKTCFIRNISKICEDCRLVEKPQLFADRDYKLFYELFQRIEKPVTYEKILEEIDMESQVINEKLWKLFTTGLLRTKEPEQI